MEKYYVVVYTEDDKGKIPGTYWFNSDKLEDPKNLHRIGGPAVERASGAKEWFENGKRHRLDGPACEPPRITPSILPGYYIDGLVYSSKQTYDAEIARRNAPPDSCDGKVVEIEGKKYQLKLVKEI